MDDIIAVLDAVGLARASLLGVSESANACALFAATYPDRCERLVLFSPYARWLRADDSPTAAPARQGPATNPESRA